MRIHEGRLLRAIRGEFEWSTHSTGNEDRCTHRGQVVPEKTHRILRSEHHISMRTKAT